MDIFQIFVEKYINDHRYFIILTLTFLLVNTLVLSLLGEQTHYISALPPRELTNSTSSGTITDVPPVMLSYESHT